MNKTIRSLTMMLSLGAMVLVPAFAFAQPADGDKPMYERGKRGKCGHGKRGKMMRGLKKHKAELGITAAQEQKFKALRDSHRAQMKNQKQQLRQLRQKMESLLAAPVIDRSQVLALRNQIKPIRQLMADQRFNAKLQFLEVLTPTQRAKLIDLRTKHRAKRDAMRKARRSQSR